MPITRKFIDWTRPALPVIADWLSDGFTVGKRLDLDRVQIVVPGRRAGHQLLEFLVARAETLGLALFPPQWTTMGSLPELLYQSKRPFATDLVQRLVWMQALREVNTQQRESFLPQLPPKEDWNNWLSLATLLWRQHTELAGEGLHFGHLVEHGQQTPGFLDTARWQFLRDLQTAYLRKLDAIDLWDRQTARLYALEHAECKTEKQIVLAATADMNRTMRLMLDQVADQVTALVYGPDHFQDRFDRFGCLKPETWSQASIPLQDNQIELVDRSQDQSQAIVDALGKLDKPCSPQDVAIGVPDVNLVPWIQNRLLQSGIPSEWSLGSNLSQAGPIRLLGAVARFIERHHVEEFAALIRHPDLYQWVLSLQPMTGSEQGPTLPLSNYISQLDQYLNDHLQPRLGEWLGRPEDFDLVQSVYESVLLWLAPLQVTADGTPISRPLHDWSRKIAEILTAIYGDRIINRTQTDDDEVCETFQKIRNALLALQNVHHSISPTLSAPQAIHILLDLLRSEHLTTCSGSQDLRLLGWLELPWDTAEHVIVTSFNEGFIPQSLDSDLFLPNHLRLALRILDNSRRYARDAYALHCLLASKKTCRLIVARRNHQGDPLKPSRLLFATDSGRLASRTLAIFNSDTHSTAVADNHPTATPGSENSQFAIFKPTPLRAKPHSMSVTSFRSYLACPYRFYLRHILQIQSLNDNARELDPASFGNVIHEVLCRFGRDDSRNSTDVDRIRKFLRQELKNYSNQMFGPDRRPAVNLQIAQARNRLDAFAQWQAAWATKGWRIEHSEVPDDGSTFQWNVDEGSIEIHGRIDRIDRHQTTGEWMVLDYKTSDKGASPAESHRRQDAWTDLQLPLYRHLVKALGIRDPVSLAYILLPKDTTKVGISRAEWSQDELNDADNQIGEVVRRVLNGNFWPPAAPAPRILTEYGALCQEGIYGQ
ncbi:MAG: hypothetical protein CMJ81_16465 [Planctomycetaceae bacterium]|nr:hypothetical protein [Planctomycetaceae bacterium]MBP62196.1 hypothetical protein [Planctomycetaceae bacterium]